VGEGSEDPKPIQPIKGRKRETSKKRRKEERRTAEVADWGELGSSS